MARYDRSDNQHRPTAEISADEARLLKIFEGRLAEQVAETIRTRLSRLALDASAVAAAIGVGFASWQVGQMVGSPPIPSLSWQMIADNAVTMLVIVCALGASIALGHLLGSRRTVLQVGGRLERDIDDDLKRIASLKERLG